MPTTTDVRVNDLIINKMTQEQYDALPEKSPTELYVIEGDSNVIYAEQAVELPTAGENNLGRIYQYIGETDANYTNGYFYKCVENIISSSAIATQTVGSNLSNLSVDVNVFENKEQPTTSGNFDFVAKFVSEHTTFNTISGDETVSGNIYQILSNKGKSSDQYWNGVIVFTNTSSCYVGPEVGTVWFNTDVHELSIFGIQIVDPGQPSVDDYIEYSYRPDEVVWQKSNNTIDINEYGISYTGSPVTDNKITVAYTMETRYSWQQVNVQPAVDPLPDQTGNAGKVLTTNGTTASWETPTTITFRTWDSNE